MMKSIKSSRLKILILDFDDTLFCTAQNSYYNSFNVIPPTASSPVLPEVNLVNKDQISSGTSKNLVSIYNYNNYLQKEIKRKSNKEQDIAVLRRSLRKYLMNK